MDQSEAGSQVAEIMCQRQSDIGKEAQATSTSNPCQDSMVSGIQNAKLLVPQDSWQKLLGFELPAVSLHTIQIWPHNHPAPTLPTQAAQALLSVQKIMCGLAGEEEITECACKATRLGDKSRVFPHMLHQKMQKTGWDTYS